MPIRVGNLLETPPADLYYQSDLLRALRDPSRTSRGCEKCCYARLCRGGLKCLSYAMTGDPFTADPGCWRAVRQRDRTGSGVFFRDTAPPDGKILAGKRLPTP